MASIKSAIEATATRGPSSVFGQVNLVSDTGEILNLWRIKEPRCLIGSGAGSTILLNEPGISGEHALIVFGKNRTLIKTLGSPIRIAGRSIAETLIDEPTHIQCGNSRLLIIPPRYANREDFAAHQVSSGTLADQTARLKNLPTGSKSLAQQFKEPEQNPDVDHRVAAVLVSEVANQSPVSTPSPSIDLSPILSALAPIQNAIAETKDRLASLQSQVQESETRVETPDNVQDFRPDLSQLIDRIDERMGAFTNQCESLFSTVSLNLDSRFNQLGDLVQKLCESSMVPVDAVSTASIAPANSSNSFEEQSLTCTPEFDGEYGFADAARSHTVDYLAIEGISEKTAGYEAEAFQPASEEPVTFQPEFEQPVAYQPAYEEPVEYASENEPPVAYQEEYQAPVDYQSTYDGADSDERSDSYQHGFYQESTQVEPASAYDPISLVGSGSDEGESFEPRNAKSKLPDWFTGYTDATSEAQVDVGQEFAASGSDSSAAGSIGSQEVAEELSVDQSTEWASAKLNPIYAEDTSSWLNKIQVHGGIDDHPEASLDDNNRIELSVTGYEEGRQIDNESNIDSDSFDYNAYGSSNATAIVGREHDDVSTEEDIFHCEEVADETPSVLAASDSNEGYLAGSADAHSNALGGNKTSVDDSSEESIEDYMNRLLQRVKGGAADEPPARPTSQPVRPSTRVIKPELPKADMREESIEANYDLSSSENNADPSSTQFSPNVSGSPRRTRPVEREENLTALRDLANMTARSAIQKSSKKRLTIGITGKASISLVGLAGGLFLLFVNGLNVNIAMLAMICSFIIFLLWGYEAIEQTKQLTQQNVKDANQQPESNTPA